MMLIGILTHVVFPVFILMGIGAVVNRLMPVDLPLLNRLVFHVFAPALVYLKLADTELNPAHLGIVAGFSLLHLVLLLLLSWKVFALGAFRSHRPVLAMGAIFYNAGNYGFPFAQLAFGDLGVSVMAIILAVQIFTNFTIGLWMAGAGGGDWRTILKTFLRVPLIYAIPLALLVNALRLETPQFVRVPLEYLAGGLIPTALVALGVQLARCKFTGNLRPLLTLTFTRLILSPLAAAGLALALGLALPGLFDQTAVEIMPILVIGMGLPVAVNVYILCAEYGQEPELASQSIFWTTLLSAFTLTGWLALFT